MENQQEGLKRELGILDVATNVINISIASGIFLLPALIAGILGNASIVAYILCGIMFILVALCYAEVGSQITTSGGAYTYIEKAFGSYFGFLANATFWFGTGVLVTAALVNGIAEMLSVSFPSLNTPPYRAVLFAVLLGYLTFVNIRGVKQGMVAVKIITLVKIIPLVLLVVVGLFHLNSSSFTWSGFPTVDKLGEASLILFFAFTGGETAMNISGEMKNPNRTGPLGLLIGCASIVLFFCLIQIVAQSTLGADLIHQKAPLAAVAGALMGTWSYSLMIACAVIAIFGSLNSIVLVYPRIMFAGANDGLMPKFLSKLHPQYATPQYAIITFTACAFLAAITGGFKQLLILATIGIILLHVGVVLAAIKFRLKKDVENPAAFKMVGGLTIPIVALMGLLWLLAQSKMNEVVGIGLFWGVLTVIYGVKVYVKK